MTEPIRPAVPASTYRLQISPSFTLYQAAALVPYFRRLGVDWLYLSPLLKSADGSAHGYDVTDPSRVDPARGGEEGLTALAWAAHRVGLGLMADLVPNHMGVADAEQNPWWFAMLRDGPDSPWAEAFDVDWLGGGGKIRLPALDGPDAAGQLRLEGHGDAARLCCGDRRFPLAAGTADDGADPATVHARQHYELIQRCGPGRDAVNYRRFFGIDSLAAVRPEIDWVFDALHALPVRWVEDGVVDGFRIDHPDGLADPAAYLSRLRECSGGAYVVVEKILTGDERLPGDWSCSGTTGYESLAQVDRLFTDPTGEPALDELDAELQGSAVSWPELTHGTRRAAADGLLRAEVLRLAGLVPRQAGLDPSTAADALAEMLTCMSVYRPYPPRGRDVVAAAAAEARRHRPDLLDALAAVEEALCVGDGQAAGDGGATDDGQATRDGGATELATRFAQTAPMVMAKGVEDNAFYRYTRLTSLTEVGADPSRFAVAPEAFHELMGRRLHLAPRSMTTLSTHDTKRGEDLRARISVLSEVAAEWTAAVRRLDELAPLPDGPLANLLWQAVIGCWPASRTRLRAYAVKAAREAGTSTSWAAPEESFERRVLDVVDAAFDDEEVSRIVKVFAGSIDGYGWSNALGAKLVQLTMPGVPDVYQGSEFPAFSLVDPDNRRDVDFERRRRELARIDSGPPPLVDGSGAAKLLVTSRALKLRRDEPGLFTTYRPVTATGDSAAHVLGFDRGGAITLAIRLPVGLARRGGWRHTSVELPYPGRDELTGKEFEAGDVPVSNLLGRYPVALLRRR